MVRRHFLMDQGVVDEFPYINNRNRDFGTPDYVIEYTANDAVRFMGGIIDMRDQYPWLGYEDISSEYKTTYFTLVRDIYDKTTGKGYWGFQGDVPKCIGAIHEQRNITIDGNTCIGIISGSLDISASYIVPSAGEPIVEIGNPTGNIKTITIPEGVEFLRSGAMLIAAIPTISNNSELTTIELPSTIRHLHVAALPEGDVQYFDQLFKIGENLQLVDFSTNIPYGDLAPNPRYYNTFTDIDLNINNPYYTNPENCGVLVQDGVLLVTSKKTTKIPSNVYELGQCCFMKSNIESMVIPSNVQYIGAGAFCHCKNLKYISIDSSVTRFENFIFGDCPQLQSIVYNGTVEQWNSVRPTYLGNGSLPRIIVHCADGDVEQL